MMLIKMVTVFSSCESCVCRRSKASTVPRNQSAGVDDVGREPSHCLRGDLDWEGLGEGGGWGGAGEGVAGEDSIMLGHRWRRPEKVHFPLPFNDVEYCWRAWLCCKWILQGWQCTVVYLPVSGVLRMRCLSWDSEKNPLPVSTKILQLYIRNSREKSTHVSWGVFLGVVAERRWDRDASH